MAINLICLCELPDQCFSRGETPQGGTCPNFVRDVRLRSKFPVQRGAFLGQFHTPKWGFIAIFVPQSGALIQKVTPMWDTILKKGPQQGKIGHYLKKYRGLLKKLPQGGQIALKVTHM